MNHDSYSCNSNRGDFCFLFVVCRSNTCWSEPRWRCCPSCPETAMWPSGGVRVGLLPGPRALRALASQRWHRPAPGLGPGPESALRAEPLKDAGASLPHCLRPWQAVPTGLGGEHHLSSAGTWCPTPHLTATGKGPLRRNPRRLAGVNLLHRDRPSQTRSQSPSPGRPSAALPDLLLGPTAPTRPLSLCEICHRG